MGKNGTPSTLAEAVAEAPPAPPSEPGEVKAIRRVAAYETTDGQTHRTRLAAEAHQGRLNLQLLAPVHMDEDDAAAFVDNLLKSPETVRWALRKHEQFLEASAPEGNGPC